MELIERQEVDGSGASWDESTSGAGGTGTSYSGGTGGGSVQNQYYTAGNGSNYGGTGGNGVAGGQKGAGNPGSTNGTGGLLIIYSEILNNNSYIITNGSKVPYSARPAGSSGGGSVNIFYKTSIIKGTVTANGGERTKGEYVGYVGTFYGGAGGTGSVSIGNISTGTYISE